MSDARDCAAGHDWTAMMEQEFPGGLWGDLPAARTIHRYCARCGADHPRGPIRTAPSPTTAGLAC